MVAPWIVWRYILRDSLLHAVLGLAAMSLLLVVQNLLRLLEEVVGAGIGAEALGQLIRLILPSYFPYAIPTALVFGVLLTFGRMSGDGEIAALRASGISVRRLLPPVLALGLLGSAASAYLLADTAPRSHHVMKSLVRELGKSVRVLKPQRFRVVGPMVIHVRAAGDGDCPLAGVLIANLPDGERPYYVTARCGSALEGTDEQGQLSVELRDGAVLFEQGTRERFRRIRFDSMIIALDLESWVGKVKARDLTTAELLALPADLDELLPAPVADAEPSRAVALQLHRRGAFALASMLLVVVAIPMGIRPVRSGRSAGALTAVALMALYWVLSSGGEIAAQEGYLPVALAIWAPNALVAGIGLYLMRRVSRLEA